MEVSSVAEFSAKAEQLGRKVILPKMPVVGVGYMAVVADTEGNIFGLWEDDKEAK